MVRKLLSRLRRKKAVTERNPWLDIPHDHDWLDANEGKELVCGMCGERKPNDRKD
jgi:hypothetical protein